MKPLDLVAAIVLPVIWGAGFTVAKGTLDEFPPVFLMGLRFTIAGLILVWFVKPMWEDAVHMVVVGFAGGLLAYGLIFSGLKNLDASITILVVQLEVVFIAILAGIFLGDRFSLRQWVAVACSFLGIMLIAGEPSVQANPLPFIMVILGGLFWSIGQVLIKSLGNVGGLRTVAWFAAFSGPQLLLGSLMVEQGQWQSVESASLKGWMAVVYLSIVMTALGYALWFRLVSRYRMNQVAPFILLVPVASVFGSVVFLGERPTAWVVAGGLIVMASVSVIHLGHVPVRR
ncbi:MAG: DMT family transporter [Rhodobacteraceae bacterium]|nr:DMT family transporter [Paracoccaceae bacterium]